VRLNASRALVNIGPEGEKALARILENPDRFARDRAAATLESHGVVRRLVEELAQDNEESEYAAGVLRSLVRAGATRHLDRLYRSLPKAAERAALGKVLTEARAEAEPELEPDDA
jgi:thioredoxin-like negative regulator of GroEL